MSAAYDITHFLQLSDDVNTTLLATARQTW